MKKILKIICYPFICIFCLFQHFSYYRIFMCFLNALWFSSAIIVPLCIISSCDINPDFTLFLTKIDGIVSNPVTLVSFAGAFVGVALTIVGFALNSFSKKDKDEKQNKILNKNADSIMVEISMLRYNGFLRSCLFLNLFSFPILTKIISLLLLLAGMLYIALFACFKIFYLGVITFLMCLLLILLLFGVFSLYTDRNFALLKNSKLMTRKILKRIRYLKLIAYPYEKWPLPYKQSLQLFARSDIVYGIDCIIKSMESITYCSSSKQSEVFLMGGLKKHFLIELIRCSFVFTEAPFHSEQENEMETKQIIFRYINSKLFDKEGLELIDALNQEKEYAADSKKYSADDKRNITRTIDDYIVLCNKEKKE